MSSQAATEKKRSRFRIADPYCPTRISSVSVNGEGTAHKGIELFDQATEQYRCVAVMSPLFNLWTNRLIVDSVEQVLAASPYNWRQERLIWNGGSFFSVQYTSDQVIEVPKVGECIALSVRCDNSYTGTSLAKISTFGTVVACLNGLMVPEFASVYSLKHISANEFDPIMAGRVIQSGLSNLEQLIPRMNALADLRADFQLLSDIARHVELPGMDWKVAVSKLAGCKSAHDVLQLLTHRVSNEGSSRGKAQISQLEAIGHYMLSVLPRKLATA